MTEEYNKVSGSSQSDNSKLSENLKFTMNVQFEDLDDEEFQLPPVSELPTLESILNEDEDPASVSDTELNISSPNQNLNPSLLGDVGDTVSVHSKASSDSRSRTSSEKISRFKKESQNKYHGSVLRHVALKGIASQLNSANERVGAGFPTSMAVGTVICVGTSHGLILVFDPSQALKCCLGSTQQGEQYGAVSALALNQESSRLLAGYSKGHVALFDIANGKLLQNIPDAHTPCTAVLHIKWTDCPGLALLSDSGGSVFEVSIKRLMGLNSNESRCIFSGSRGEVCTIEPLIMGQFLTLPPVVDTIIVAMATMSKVIVISLRPNLKVHFSYPLESSAAMLPVLAWQFVIIQMPDGSKVIDPVLAFGRESTLFFYQLTHGSMDELKFIFLQKMDTSYVFQATAWLNSRTFVVMDTKEKLHVIDMKTQEELDIADLARLGLVYASSHFKGLATGGNVSKAMAVAGERACYHSIMSFGSQILLLGTKSFQVVTMRSWNERVEYLVRNGNVAEALQLVLDIYKDRAQGIVGLTHKKERRRNLLKGKILDLLDSYLDQANETCPDRGNINKLRSFYQQIVPHCVNVAVEAGFHNVLFGKIWDTFSEDAISKGIFLESLEPYILDDQIPDISPSVTQCFLSHCEAKHRLLAAEACIVHLNIPSLDLHQTMTLCWTYGLYDALFYIYTRGMSDYITPLEELLTLLKGALDCRQPLTDTQVSLGNKILVYISCCLAGRAYPYGDIDSDLLKKVKHEVFVCITRLHTKNHQEEEPPYPLLRTLLRFDTREFLNVLAIAFQEEEFSSELGLIQRQRVVDILLQVMVNDPEFNAVQMGSLFTFIARQMSKQRGALALNKDLIEQVLNHLTDPKTEVYHEERQTALLELLQEGGLAHFDQEVLLQKAKGAQFYRVLENIYEKKEDYGNILECYIFDKLRRVQAFTYIRTVLYSPYFTPHHKAQVNDKILLHIKALLRIDTTEMATLLLSVECLSSLIAKIAELLLGDKEILYDYLQALFRARSLHSAPHSERSGKAEEESANENSSLFLELQEKYISLMAEMYPHKVYNYLNGINGYRLEPILEICRKFSLDESTALLLEKRGDIIGAYDIHMNLLKKEIMKIRLCKENGTNLPTSLLQLEFESKKIVRLCRLGSANAEENERKRLWFSLLDELLKIQPLVSHDENIASEMQRMIGNVVNNTMTHISLPSILERIVQSEGYSDCNFGQIRHLLKDMVERYTYEDTLYSAIINLMRKDQLHYLAQMRQERSSPLSVTSTSCSLCHSNYQTSSNVMVYSCGHGYHSECGGEGSVCVVCSGSIPSHIPQTSSCPSVPDTTDLKLTLDDLQNEGLKRMQVLDIKTTHSFEGDSQNPFSNRNEEIDLSSTKDFALKLAPLSLTRSFDD